MQIKILYEDEYILALDKPSGLLVHGDGRSEENTLVDWINTNYPELKEVGEEQTLQNGEVIKRPGIVHRLDRDTSGVILVAKTKEAHQFLKEQFQSRQVEKIYNAVVWGTFIEKLKEGKIEKFIGRNQNGLWSTQIKPNGKQREAVTEYRVLFPLPHPSPLLAKEREEEKKSESSDQKFSYLEVRPKTGRTHQIRVHLKSISHPVVCDKLYSNKSCTKEECLGFDRLALHALSIKLKLPNHSFITIESPLPVEFEKAKESLK